MFTLRVLSSSMLMAAAVACGGSEPIDPGGGGGGGGNCPANTICMTGSAFSPSSRTVGVNATVTWSNNSTVEHNVTFTNPEAALGVGNASGGDFDAPASSSNQRRFAVAGTHPFHCTIHGSPTQGMTGTVVVQ